MPCALARNMSMMSRHHAAVRPVEIRPESLGSGQSDAVVADLGPAARRLRSASDLAGWLLARLGEPLSKDPVEALRARIEREVESRGLVGCAVVAPAGRNGKAEGRDRPRVITDLPLALVLLSKASDIVWVARKTPIVDIETLGRRLLTRDPRFVTGETR